jgi:energy-coupling factor transporter ATP-binding protein EcfA2
MVDLRNKPLLDTTADAALFVEPPALGRIDAALRQGLNVAILGERGAGKTSLLRQLTRRLREQGKPVAFVNAEPAVDIADALRTVREQLAGADSIPEALQQAAAAPPESDRPADLARSLAVTASEPTVIVVDGIDADTGHELFGRLRDVLWQAPVTWVVAARSSERGLLTPPADAFFEQVSELPPMEVAQLDELLERRLGDDAVKLPVLEIAQASEGNPRRALELAREVVIDRQDLAHVLEERARREARASELGRAPSMLLTEIEQLGRPVWSSDQDLLQRMGWTRARAVQVLGQLEDEGLLRSYTDRGPRGGTVKMFTVDRPVWE